MKHICSEGVALSCLSSPQLWKRNPRGLQCPGTILPFRLEITSFPKGEIRAEWHAFERMAGEARRTRSHSGRRGYRPSWMVFCSPVAAGVPASGRPLAQGAVLAETGGVPTL